VICADGGAALGYAVKAERFLPGPFAQAEPGSGGPTA